MKTIYGNKRCPKCLQLKRQLKSSNETFKYVDTDTLNAYEIAELIIKSGTMSLPIIMED